MAHDPHVSLAHREALADRSGGLTIDERVLQDLARALRDLGQAVGTFYAANITPDPTTGIGRYTDGELARVLRHPGTQFVTPNLTPEALGGEPRRRARLADRGKHAP